MLLLSLTLAYVGFFALALTQERHRVHLMRGKHTQESGRVLAATGWVFLLASLWPALIYWGFSIGLAGWFGLLTLSALALIALLAYAPKAAGYLALFGPACAFALTLIV
ncbi:MAG: DUF3325 domain-containing protein [Campylobacterales bacterium]